MDHADALTVIRHEAGKGFDPDVVAVFLELVDGQRVS
jgi:HD-GYP domain-containing protein (c-di-GMP phosphodiesterase class II)